MARPAGEPGVHQHHLLALTLIVRNMFIRITDMDGKSRQIRERKSRFLSGPKAGVSLAEI
jgi:hypothetical protein